MSSVPLKRLLAVPPMYGLNVTPDRYRDDGIRLLRTGDVSDDGTLSTDRGVYLDRADCPDEMLLRTGDVLFSRSGTIGRAFLFDESRHGPATYAGFLVRFRLRREIDPRVIRYWSESAPFVGAVHSGAIQSTISNFNAERYANLNVPGAIVSDSRAIADHLDAETARIDALLALRRRQRDAIVERLGSEVERRVLGLIGALQAAETAGYFTGRPRGWREASLRHLGVEVQTGPFGSQLHAGEYVEGGTPVINPMHLVAGEIVPSTGMAVDEAKRRELSRHILRVDDIVLARRGELGRVARVDAASAGYLCGTGSMRLRLQQSPLRPGYLSMLLSSAPLRAYFELASVGSTMDNLSAETVLSAPALVPPLTDQAEIEGAVARARASALDATGVISQQIDLLVERRQALITAAVTGQLDIPGVAA